MDAYLLAKTIHILSAAVLFGTGLGIAFFFLMGMRSGDPVMAWFAARTTAVADMIFTLTAGIVQPVSGFWLVFTTGIDPLSHWLLVTYALYLIALACWLPVVWLQLRMRDMLAARVAGGAFDQARFDRYFRRWFVLGWPAFVGLVAVFWLMVAKPRMSIRVLILGGYGNFGGYVARALADDPAIALIVVGRDGAKARAFAASLGAANAAEGAALDIFGELAGPLAALRPDMVIHTVGPFQTQDYRVAEAAIAAGAHYCDLADARAFVCGIDALDAPARGAGVAVISGASSVPCLTAAYLDDALRDFAVIESVDYGISAAQQTNRGLGTASAILSYVGRPFTMLRQGVTRRVYGWQGLHSEVYPELGRRWFGDCDIPDLDLFPARYPGLRQMRFCAGHEIALLHFGTWLLSWGVRLRLLPRLDRWGGPLLRASFLFDRLGSGRSGFHMRLDGKDAAGWPLTRREWLIARSGHGPNIPCMPAILLARRLALGKRLESGARPCVGEIGLEEFLAALAGLDITVIRQ